VLVLEWGFGVRLDAAVETGAGARMVAGFGVGWCVGTGVGKQSALVCRWSWCWCWRVGVGGWNGVGA
jgi:hypothetical protein